MFYIYNCNNEIIGNIKGYRTFKGASTQTTGIRYKVHKLLWDAYFNRTDKSDTTLCTIRDYIK